MGATDDPECPVTHVSYVDCQEFVARLNACGDRKYRLPTYCEWFYAARGGTAPIPLVVDPRQLQWGERWSAAAGRRAEPLYGCGTSDAELAKYAWSDWFWKEYDDEAIALRKRYLKSPKPVGRLKPNPWGLYDMAGNVCEWVHDRYDPWYYNVERYGPTKTDPMGPGGGWTRLVCGGHFRSPPYQILGTPSSSHRPHYRGFGLGFRLQRAVP